MNLKIDLIDLELEKSIDLEIEKEIARSFKNDRGLYAELILLQRITRLLEKLVKKY